VFEILILMALAAVAVVGFGVLTLFGGVIKIFFHVLTLPLVIGFWIVKALLFVVLLAVGIAFLPALLIAGLVALVIAIPVLMLCGVSAVFAIV